MNPDYTRDDFTLDVAGKRWPGAIAKPCKLADNPAIIINLAGHIKQILETNPYRRTGDAFLEAGHYVATFDLPNHGQLVDEYGEGIKGIATAMRAGIDRYREVTLMCKATIDHILDKGYVAPDRVYVGGTSRGGFSAILCTAADPRIRACAAIAPVTYLPHLREWHGDEDVEFVKQTSALAVADKVATRPLWVIINRVDDRVSTDHCTAFVNAVRAAGGNAELVYLDAEGHGLAEHAYYDAGAWLLTQAQSQ